MLAGELRRDRILVNAVCPGWVATDMGGPSGRPVGEGAASVLWAVGLPDGGPTGGFHRDGRPGPLVTRPLETDGHRVGCRVSRSTVACCTAGGVDGMGIVRPAAHSGA
jgi:NAD(P)-dependent dehydrogenase (short-subunit alcohol dehydrogenase family)